MTFQGRRSRSSSNVHGHLENSISPEPLKVFQPDFFTNTRGPPKRITAEAYWWTFCRQWPASFLEWIVEQFGKYNTLFNKDMDWQTCLPHTSRHQYIYKITFIHSNLTAWASITGEDAGTSPPEFGVGGANANCPPQILSCRYKKERSVAFKIRQNPFSTEASPRPRWGELTTFSKPSLLGRGHPSPYSTPLGTDPPSALAMRLNRSPARSTPMLSSCWYADGCWWWCASDLRIGSGVGYVDAYVILSCICLFLLPVTTAYVILRSADLHGHRLRNYGIRGIHSLTRATGNSRLKAQNSSLAKEKFPKIPIQ